MSGLALPNGQVLVRSEEILIDLGRTKPLTDKEGNVVLGEDGQPQIQQLMHQQQIPSEAMPNGEFMLLLEQTRLQAEVLRELVFLRGQVMLMANLMQQLVQQVQPKPAPTPYEPQGARVKIMRDHQSPNGKHSGGH